MSSASVVVSALFFEQDLTKLTVASGLHSKEEFGLNVVKKGIRFMEPSLAMVELRVTPGAEILVYRGYDSANNVFTSEVKLPNLESYNKHELPLHFIKDSRTSNLSDCYFYLWPVYLTTSLKSESQLTTTYFMRLVDSCDLHCQEVPKSLLSAAMKHFKSPRSINSITQGSAPRSFEHFDALKSRGVNKIISMQEARDWATGHCPVVNGCLWNESSQFEEACRERGMEWRNVPVADMSDESRVSKAVAIYKVLDKYVTPDTKLYIHCNAGIGRASLVNFILLSCILEISPEIACLMVSLTRPVSFVEEASYMASYNAIKAQR